jgi:DNA-directed RNA polymerase subunit RPC12/RpoP
MWGEVMTGTVKSEEMLGEDGKPWRPTKPPRPLPKKGPTEHPKYKRALPGGICRRCGEKMLMKFRNPTAKGDVHITYWCEKCKRARVGVEVHESNKSVGGDSRSVQPSSPVRFQS